MDATDSNINSGSTAPNPTDVEQERTEMLLEDTTERMVRDMKFVSIFTIIVGIFYCLTFFGAIFGIPLIIAGIRLRDGANAYNSFLDNRDSYSLERAFRYQQKFFFIGKILIIISIALFILYVAGMIFFFSHFIDSMEMMKNFDGRLV